MESSILTTHDGAAESSVSAVSWGPVIAGAVVATAVSLCLLILGSGLGLSMVSPWAHDSVSATTFGVTTAIWLVVMQWVSAALGGYLTGRVRTKWTGARTDEVFFRDTAHGFLTWALSTIVVAWLMGSALGGIVNAGTQAVSTLGAGAAMGAAAGADEAAASASNGYLVDRLLRPAPGATAPADARPAAEMAAARDEAGRIIVSGIAAGEVSADDKTYLAQMISSRTGVPQADAEARVTDLIARIDAAKAQAKEAADTARKTGITMSLAMFLSLLIGAFIACAAAALGGSQRDDDVLVVSR